MGILEHVSGLEDMMSGMEEAEKPKQKQKKAEAARPDSLSNSRLEKIEGDMEALRETVRGIGREKGAAGENSLQDILRRLDETDKKIDETVADVGEKIETLKKAQTGENRGFFGLKPDSEKRIDEAIKKLDKNSEIIVKKQEEIIIGIEERIRNFEETAKSSGGKNSLELRSKMDALQKYVEGKMGAMDKMIDEKIGSSAADGRIKMLEKKQGEMKSLMQCGSSGINSGIDGRINDAVKKWTIPQPESQKNRKASGKS
ncbi:MAG: hypothetical protein KKB25_03610 [Nanoarchaeota archaeon]|nr:hypothetical protein [Nanoarchaeota archaeon]